MNGITLCFPHLDNPWNSAVLELKKQMLRENSRHPYQLFFVTGTTKDDVYPAWDWLFRHAKYDIVLWDNSDIVYADGWDEPIHQYMDQADWLSLRVVECGQIGVAPTNIRKDFGITAETFRRSEFETWCKADATRRPPISDGWSWYSPSAFKKSWYTEVGGFDLSLPSFPHPIDSAFKDRVADRCRFKVCNSYAYHFQYAGENQGTKPERVG